MNEKFWSEVVVGGEHWTRGTPRKQDGYSKFGFGDKNLLAHRVSYIEAYGPIPKGWHAHHKCDNRACIRPSHLVAMSHRDHLLLHLRRDGNRANDERRAKTHCKWGHAFDDENTRIEKKGNRKCKECHRRQNAESGRRRRIGK